MENSAITTAKTLLVSFTAKDSEASSELKNALNYLADMSKHEDGILRYEVFRSENNPLDYYVLETWSGDLALEKHLTQIHVLDFVQHCKHLLAVPFTIVPLAIPFKPDWLKPLLTDSISLN